jgi:hypothetical protein
VASSPPSSVASSPPSSPVLLALGSGRQVRVQKLQHRTTWQAVVAQ